MRCFVAVDIDSGLKHKIAFLQDQLKLPGIKPIEPENLHFTLKFLGEIDDDMVAGVKERLDSLKGYEAFDVDLKGAGVFPSMNYARVVWIGAEKLFNLQEHVNEILISLFRKDRGIKPHLTIARVKFLKDRQRLQRFLEENIEVEIGSMNVKEVLLKKSTLTPKGPIYENLSSFLLKSKDVL